MTLTAQSEGRPTVRDPGGTRRASPVSSATPHDRPEDTTDGVTDDGTAGGTQIPTLIGPRTSDDVVVPRGTRAASSGHSCTPGGRAVRPAVGPPGCRHSALPYSEMRCTASDARAGGPGTQPGPRRSWFRRPTLTGGRPVRPGPRRARHRADRRWPGPAHGSWGQATPGDAGGVRVRDAVVAERRREHAWRRRGHPARETSSGDASGW